MKNKQGSILITAGLLLMAAALCLTIYNLSSDYQASKSVSNVLAQMEPVEILPEEEPVVSVSEIEIPDYVLNPNMDMPSETIDGQEYIGILEIPALELRLPIISEWSAAAGKIAPCRDYGSVYLNDMVIAGHNYQSHFASLYQLEEGDRIVFTDMDGNSFKYNVVGKETLPPTAVEDILQGPYDLTLYTCTMDSSNRVVIRCDLVSESADSYQ